MGLTTLARQFLTLCMWSVVVVDETADKNESTWSSLQLTISKAIARVWAVLISFIFSVCVHQKRKTINCVIYRDYVMLITVEYKL